MPRVTVDFSEVEEFEPLEKGEYPIVVDRVEFVEAATEDKYDYLTWELTVAEDPGKGRKLWFRTSFSPKALWRMKQVFENLGLPTDEIEIDYDEDDMTVTDPELAGLAATAVVSVSPYEGRQVNNVDNLISSEDGAPAAEAKDTSSSGKDKKEKTQTRSRRRFQ